MGGACPEFSFSPASYHVTRAVLVGAEKRPAPHHFFLCTGFRRIVGIYGPSRIERNFSFRGTPVIVRPVPITAPFPYVTGKVVKAKQICRETLHGSQSSITILPFVSQWKLPLPGIGHPFITGFEFVAP